MEQVTEATGGQREKGGKGGQGDGNNPAEDPWAGSKSCRQNCKNLQKNVQGLEQRAKKLLPLCFIQEKKSDFAWIKKLDYDKKYLLLSSAYPITETTHKTPQSA